MVITKFTSITNCHLASFNENKRGMENHLQLMEEKFRLDK
jgi:hypothetical protein